MPDIGQVLKRYRDKFHLTQSEVVARAGLDRSSSYISSLETNKASPTPQPRIPPIIIRSSAEVVR